MPNALPTSLPFGRTARRLEWAHLPPELRRLVEARIGAPVVAAASQTGGFTPGFASVLTDVHGIHHFVKAASTKAQAPFADAYREEARKLGALPGTAPAPRLLWFEDGEDWVSLETEYVDGRAPGRPWSAADLAASLDALATIAATMTPPPAALGLASFAEDFADFPGGWDHVRATRPELPHLEEAAALAARFAEVCAGETLVHTDARDDNILIRPDGSAVLCDWNWPCAGAAWLDSVFLMVGPRGDGLDVDAVLAERPLTAGVPAEHVDVVIALLVGYFWRQGDQFSPPTSPYLRAFQRWQGEVCWDWLVERRGW